MKKIVLMVAACLCLCNAQAQIGSNLKINAFVSAKGGIGIYHNSRNDNPAGFSGGFSVGKWILSPFAFRASFDFIAIPNGDALAGFELCSAEFLWDFNSTFTHIRDWRLNAYPMLGLGVVFHEADMASRASADLQAMVGVHVPVRLGKGGWDVFLEYKCNFFPEKFDGSDASVYMHSLLAGVTRRFTPSPFLRRTPYESRGLAEDWFLGFGIGPNFTSYRARNIDKAGMYGVAPEIMFGRNFSDFWTIRFQLVGLRAHGPYDSEGQRAGEAFSFSDFHTDVMVNLTHALRFTRGIRLNVLPYLGAGMVWRYDNLQFDMAADFGVLFRYYVGHKSDLYAEAKYIVALPRIARGSDPEVLAAAGHVRWVGLPSLTVGYIYNFGRSTTRYRLPAHWSADRGTGNRKLG